MERIVSAAIHPKLCGNYAFPQNVHARKLGEITVFFAVLYFNSNNYGIVYQIILNLFQLNFACLFSER